MFDRGHSLLEERRLEKLYSYSILDTPDETAFNQIADDIGFTLGVPTGMINFVDRNRVWFKACVQVENRVQVSEAPRQVAFCSYTILSDDALVVPNMLEDPRFCHNPLVTGEMHVRAYAGVPLITREGQRIGTICCMDDRPRSFSERDLEHLRRAARRILSELEQRLLRMEYRQVMEQLQALMVVSPSGIVLLDDQNVVLGFNPAVKDITGMQWSVGEHFDMNMLLPDDRISGKGTTYARWMGQGWFSLTRVPLQDQNRTLLVLEDVTDHIQLQLSLSDMAYKDQLTVLSNRNAFYASLETVLDQPDLAVAFLDLDGFKKVNDTHGHHAGDALLQEVARRLKEAVRSSDRVFRLAGDEFTLILRRDVSDGALQGIAERVLQGIQQPFVFDGQRVPFGVSLGITRIQPGDTSDALLSRADALMY